MSTKTNPRRAARRALLPIWNADLVFGGEPTPREIQFKTVRALTADVAAQNVVDSRWR